MKLSAYLEKHRISQEQFGQRLGVSQGLVWQLINGITGYTNERVRQIAQETDYEVSPNDMLPEVFPPGFRFP